MSNGGKVASAEYETFHNGKSYLCKGSIVATEEGYLLRERIQVGVDHGPGREAYDERSRALSPVEAKKVLQEWMNLDIAEILQIPWD